MRFFFIVNEAVVEYPYPILFQYDLCIPLFAYSSVHLGDASGKIVSMFRNMKKTTIISAITLNMANTDLIIEVVIEDAREFGLAK